MNRRIFALASILFSAMAMLPPRVAAARELVRYSWAYDGTRRTLSIAIINFFKLTRGRYLSLRHVDNSTMNHHARSLLSSQFLHVFNGLPDVERSTLTGYRILSGSKARDSTIKAYLVTQGSSNLIVAAALFHDKSGFQNELDESVRIQRAAKGYPRELTIFYPRNITPIDSVTKALVEIVTAQVRSDTRRGQNESFKVELRRMRYA
jgi:hypothetical protein